MRYAWAAAGLLGVQILVGALNVWLDEYELLILLHLTLGTLLWASGLDDGHAARARAAGPGGAGMIAAAVALPQRGPRTTSR